MAGVRQRQAELLREQGEIGSKRARQRAVVKKLVGMIVGRLSGPVEEAILQVRVAVLANSRGSIAGIVIGAALAPYFPGLWLAISAADEIDVSLE